MSQGVTPRDLAEAIDAQGIAKHLCAADLPDTDLVIRTSGEARLACCRRSSCPTAGWLSFSATTKRGPRHQGQFPPGRGFHLPFLILTANDRRRDRARALEEGADDYVVKPFDYADHMARLPAKLARSDARIETFPGAGYRIVSLSR